MIESTEWRRVDGQMHAAIRQRRHHLAAITEIERVAIGDRLLCYSQVGTSVCVAKIRRESIASASFMNTTRCENMRSACAVLRRRFSITERSPSVVTTSTP